MAYAHIALHRRGKGSPNSTWTRNGDKSFTNAHKRLASLTFECVCVWFTVVYTRECVFFLPAGRHIVWPHFPVPGPKQIHNIYIIHKDDVAFARTHTHIWYGLCTYIFEGIPFVLDALTYIYKLYLGTEYL